MIIAKNRATVRDCEVCGGPVPARAHQAPGVRTCGPRCASTLARVEHPDLEPSMHRRLARLAGAI
jgi:hypothetical protein